MAKEARPHRKPEPTEAELEKRRFTLIRGVRQFNSGYFFESHETWEDLWLDSPEPMRTYLQGVIQLAAAFVHLMRHEYPGTIRLLDAGIQKLESFPSEYLGFDSALLVSEARRAHLELAELGSNRFEKWDQSRIPKIHLTGDAAGPELSSS